MSSRKMKASSITSKAAMLFSSLLLFLLLIFSSLNHIIFDTKFYEKEFEKHGIYGRFAQERALAERDILLDYFRNDDQKISSDFYNEREKAHLLDVKPLIKASIGIFHILLASFIISLAYLFYRDRKEFGRNLSRIFLISSLAAFLLIAAAFLLRESFSEIFFDFHLIFFDNDLWMLDPATDNLINLFPEGFFYDAVGRIGALILSLLASASIIAIFSRFSSGHHRR